MECDHELTELTRDELSGIEREFTRLKDKCYLDHAGTTLYADSQIRAVQQCLTENLLCNPHTSRTTEDLIDQVRFRTLRHFNVRSTEYSVIFTSGATASLRLVAEYFHFGQSGSFVYLSDNHTSVLGMREIVSTKRIVPIIREQLIPEETIGTENALDADSLLVFPAQCNFNGVKYPLEMITEIQRNGLNGYSRERFHICLDAASYAGTSFLDLSIYKPDFVCLSFYKIFGFPTGLGALLVRKDASDLLRKRYYGGGTVKIAMAGQNFHVKRDSLVERFEDGTVPFTSIVSVLQGFDTLERLVPSRGLGRSSIKRISHHTFLIGQYCYRRLEALRYPSGGEVIRLYHDTKFENRSLQGGIVNFNLLHEDGSFIGFAEFAYLASVHNIILRTGCFCNPGACQRLLGLTDEDVLKQFKAGHVCGDANDLIDGQPTGSVRVSFGYMSQQRDVDRLVEMIEKCYLRKTLHNGISRTQIVSSYKNHDQPRLKVICLFPIKSCGAFKISDSWPLCRKGLKYDREFVIVDENGVALTQKNLTEMCLIQPRINLQTKEMVLSHPKMPELALDLRMLSNKGRSIKFCQTKVCQDEVQAVDCGDEVADWLSLALQTSGLRLLRQAADEVRTFQHSTKEIALSNQAQFLLINQASVRWLADKVPDWDDLGTEPNLDSLVDRFRGNLIVDGVQAMEEIGWKRVTIGDRLEFAVDGPCSRCQMVCIDQRTGLKTVEPLRTIAREFKGKICFGIYLSHSAFDLSSPDEIFLHCGSTIHGTIE
ncbi:molybdenum cofactor sulfurase 3-like [Wyeomyia smithii]|uniref:molybdenum cofactor sulfurase 3-like n=1 Tax=Wyeomyia smithii TaxID=174621 RepID=UPI002467F70E|nr:molybdenum cofactor sulfurase 3-like [Wyeomyia smithii]XP_055523546.1 molybdenum cofactor sulfurase 3-like [Wyeomyia smithii]XP_055523556.1 molybdenum cofactor sulfurase 3-like [Wyeomyia smithii]XP_055523567.1 molybdenum cofactor sulfurase 3-like [Wyeomyia smithii]